MVAKLDVGELVAAKIELLEFRECAYVDCLKLVGCKAQKRDVCMCCKVFYISKRIA